MIHSVILFFISGIMDMFEIFILQLLRVQHHIYKQNKQLLENIHEFGKIKLYHRVPDVQTDGDLFLEGVNVQHYGIMLTESVIRVFESELHVLILGQLDTQRIIIIEMGHFG